MESDYPDHLSGDSGIDRFTSRVGHVAKWLCVVLVLLQFGVVVARYLFDTGSVMAQEAILYLFGTMFMMSLADALKNNRHVRVDMLYHNFSPRTRRMIDGIGIVVFLFTLCAFIFWVSWGYVASSWVAQEGSREAGGLPGVYLFKTVILIAIAFLVLQAFAILRRCWRSGGSENG